ncbi:FAD-dependent oxidoreductase [Chitinophaga nivalis]|uniref:FAD-binding domain-containing protein n=1 Tax=Chitinophaga nivalis TaxID=2991709 RepID=A0ABT3IJB0_9BACT|nr:hypothetical protein [Chitinophaga nivalis]MCW3466244.1 hypothetical protein [Chitinophaga nivalis]MCW3484065.1 hypothetical protein [Chitinophaga nivalis]
MQRPLLKKAIVLGGSITGLLTATVLATFFEEVLLLEKDHLPETTAPRKSVPQDQHAHTILQKTLLFIEAQYPGICSEITATGGNIIDTSSDVCWLFQDGWRQRHHSGLQALLTTRPNLDQHLYRRMRAKYPHVQCRQCCKTTGYLYHPASHQITGVHILNETGQPETLSADLVVDAMGRFSRSPEWLQQAGLGSPETAEVKMQLAYSSRIYQQPDHTPPNWKSMALYPSFPHTWKSGIIADIGNRQWLVSLCGYFGDCAPAADDGFLNFARDLRSPDIYQLLKDSQPLTLVKIHKVSKNIRHYYEKFRQLPDGFIVLGDAHCAFNPIFGQGICIATANVMALHQQLQRLYAQKQPSLRGFSAPFQKAIAAQADLPWFLTNTIDLSYKQAEGKRPLGHTLLYRFLRKAIAAGSCSTRLNQIFLKVLHLEASRKDLFNPLIAVTMLRHELLSMFTPAAHKALIRPVNHPQEVVTS